MARTMSAGNGKANGEDGPTKGHNVKELKKVIRECAQTMVRIKKERKELNEEAGDVRKRIKEHGIQPDSFDFAVKQLEREPEARKTYIDDINIAFEALGIGGQVDMIEATGADSADDLDLASMPEFDAGKGVAKAGGERTDHDYQDGTDEAKAWQAGWDEGKTERAAATKKPKPRKGKTSERATA